MKDDTFNASTSGAATIAFDGVASGTIGIGITKSSASETEQLRRQIGRLESEMRKQQKNIEDLLDRIEQYKVANFTQEEFMFILSRVHPDKNPDSKLAHQLTQKLIRKRNG